MEYPGNSNFVASVGPDGDGSAIESLRCKTAVLSSTGIFTFEVEGFTNLSDDVGGTNNYFILYFQL